MILNFLALNTAIYKCSAKYIFVSYPVFYAYDMHLNTPKKFSVIYTKIYYSANGNHYSLLSSIIRKLKYEYNVWHPLNESALCSTKYMSVII